MTGRRAVVGLSLLCALLFSAFAAQSASAKGTTSFTCVNLGAKQGDFSDAHCDTFVGANNGSFGHVVIAEGTETSTESTNKETKNATKESTNAVLIGEVALTKTEITCTVVTGTATSTNKTIGGVMQNEGSGKLEFKTCTVNKPLKCTVKEPIVSKGTSITREDLGAGKNEKGVEFKPETGKPFVEITFEGAECALKGKTFPVEGTAIATGGRGSSEATTSSGATLLFTKAMTKETLKFGGKPAEFEATVTEKMVGGNPISLTTTTP